MKKILMLTTVYPSSDLKMTNNTNVCHYFAKEWAKQGYDVLVIHNYPIYMRILHVISSFFSSFIASKFSTLVTTSYVSKDKIYEMDGVKIVRLPLFKPFPRLPVPQKGMSKHIKKIAYYCDLLNFKPDVITAHFFYPHVPMVNCLKEKYFQNAKTCVVVHKQNWKMLSYLGVEQTEVLKKIDVWGFRSIPIKNEFVKYSNFVPQKNFQCYSGIPSHFVARDDVCVISHPINKFVFVGSFIHRKYPEKILMALKRCHIENFRMDYIGDGENRSIMENFVKKEKWQNCVFFHGFVQRDMVPTYIAQSQCFIMISKDETFGLVYLEAMSMGCITIASRDEGMEGIIKDGVNGFLCKAGDDNELSQIINRINAMDVQQLRAISERAKKTAFNLTDSLVAQMYIDNIIHIGQST